MPASGLPEAAVASASGSQLPRSAMATRVACRLAAKRSRAPWASAAEPLKASKGSAPLARPSAPARMASGTSTSWFRLAAVHSVRVLKGSGSWPASSLAITPSTTCSWTGSSGPFTLVTPAVGVGVGVGVGVAVGVGVGVGLLVGAGVGVGLPERESLSEPPPHAVSSRVVLARPASSNFEEAIR